MKRYSRNVRIVLVAAVFVCLAVFFAFVSKRSISQAEQSALLPPSLNATKAVTEVAGLSNADGNADPGETLEYTITINNAAAPGAGNDANGVAISDTLQNITSFVAGSTVASPVAANDTFSSIGNVGISVADGTSDLLANDLDANNPGSSSALTISVAPTTSAQGGNVSINTTTGSFTYNPAPGFEGTDTFSYTLSNGTGLTDTATVTINVSGMIWFINNTSPACTTLAARCGRLSNPFSTLAAFQALNNGTGNNPEANDNIFIYESATGYAGGVSLLSGQRLIGQDATATLNSIAGLTLPAFSNPLPTMNSGNATFTNRTGTTTLNTNAVVRGLRVNSTSSTGLNDPAGAISGVTISEIATVTTTTATAILLSDVGATISITNVSSNGSTTGISLTNTTGSFSVTGAGTPASGGTIQNTSGNGISLQNAQNVSLGWMNLNLNLGSGIFGDDVTNFALANSTVTNSGDVLGGSETGLRFNELLGTNTITNSTISHSISDQIRLTPTSGTGSLTITGTTIGPKPVTNGGNGIAIVPIGTARVTVNISGSIFTGNLASGFLTSFGNTSQGNFNVSNNTFTGNNIGFDLGLSLSTTNFVVDNNTFTNHAGSAINFVSDANATTAAVANGRINGNTIGNGAVDSGSVNSFGIAVDMRGDQQTIVEITNNQVRNTDIEAYFIQTRLDNPGSPGTGKLDLTFTGNTGQIPDDNSAFPFGAIYGSRIESRNATEVCLDFSANDAIGRGGLQDFRFRQRDTSVFKLERFGGSGTTIGDIQTFMLAQSPLLATANATVATTYTGVANGACLNPVIPFSLADVEASVKDGEVADSALAEMRTGEWRYNERSSIESPAPSRSDLTSKRHVFETVQTTVGEFPAKLGEMMPPMVYGRETKPASPESGETITKSLGTLPAGESIVVKFRATVNNGPFASGVNAVTNQASVAGTNFAAISSNTTSINLAAAPDLLVTKTEGGGTTQPGSQLSYTLTYSNATAVNGQDAANVILTETVPANTTFSPAASTPGWLCSPNNNAGSTCTFPVGNVTAGAAAENATFIVNVAALLPVNNASVSNTASVAENPNVNGPDRMAGNNDGTDSTPVIGNWLGAVSTDWNDPANWSNNTLPPAGNNISVPNAANQPTLSTSDVTVNTMTLARNVAIGPSRTLTVNGSLVLGSNVVDGQGTLLLGPSAPAVSQTTGQVNSTLAKVFTGPGSFSFPVGTTGQFSPALVNVTAGSGTFNVRARTGTVPATIPQDPGMTLQRYWSLDADGITADVTLNYLQTDVVGNENNYRLLRVEAGNKMSIANEAPCPGSGRFCVDTGANTIFLGQVSIFSDWTASELAPTAADVVVAGKVVTSSNRAISRAFVTITDPDTNLHYQTRTNTFGWFRFEGIRVGRSYVLTVAHSRYLFDQPSMVVNVVDSIGDIEFTGRLP